MKMVQSRHETDLSDENGSDVNHLPKPQRLCRRRDRPGRCGLVIKELAHFPSPQASPGRDRQWPISCPNNDCRSLPIWFGFHGVLLFHIRRSASCSRNSQCCLAAHVELGFDAAEINPQMRQLME